MFELIIEVTNANGVAASLTEADNKLKRNMARWVRDGSKLMLKTVEEYTPIGATHELIDSMQSTISSGANEVIGTTFSGDIPAKVAAVELGRGAGTAPPPTDAIFEWATWKFGPSITWSDAWRIAQSIGENGIEGRHMFQQAFDREAGTVMSMADRIVEGL